MSSRLFPKLLLGSSLVATATALYQFKQQKNKILATRQPVAGVAASSFVLEPFRPIHTNPHLQTFLAHFVREDGDVSFERERLELPDGDFIDLDFAQVNGRSWETLGNSAPIVLLLHGLEGSARRSYACELYRQLAQRGIRAVGMNFRSCSDEENRLARTYHAGETTDLDYIFHLLRNRYPAVLLSVVGFSLGGNVLLKYLGEQGEKMQGKMKTAVVVSPPFDMQAGARTLDFGSGQLYRSYLLRKLQAKLKRREALLRDELDWESALLAKTFHEFDEYCTAPLNGFSSALDYYEQTSSGPYLPNIRIPTLILRAEDDPFFAADIPYQTIAQNSYLHSGFVAHGGHVAFIEGTVFDSIGFWAERQAARFIAHSSL
ncbi:MAG: alpha/beta fold hydrolase [Chloroflexota bacterium]